ncbi:(2Fe-2S)-binding protein [bacterium]|nr:(2Fe-2S)-binding protein [bacterium]
MRIIEHPILTFKRGKKVTFTCDGMPLEGFEGEPVAAALHDAGITTLSYSLRHKRPRGFYCAIGHCSSCLMEVNGRPNVRVCTEPLCEGMVVKTQEGKGVLK